MKSKVVVLLSAGLDSSVNLYRVARDHEVALALTFDYGQKAAKKELESAQKLARQMQVQHKTLNLSWFKDFNRSSLLVDNEAVPTGAQVQLDDKIASQASAKSVWVPNRNGIFLNIAAAFAEALEAQYVVPGFNSEEAAAFPDNSQAFMDKLDSCFFYSTANKVQVKCYTSALDKTEIVALGEQLHVPWHLIWPCYFSEEKWCGQCESCQRAKRAFKSVQVPVEALFND